MNSDRTQSAIRCGAVVTTSLMILPLSACQVPFTGPERSVKSFCDTYWQQKHDYLAKYDARAAQQETLRKADPVTAMLVGLGSSVEALGDVVVMFAKLDKVAPDDIEPDVAAIHDALKSEIDNAGSDVTDPLGGLAGGLVSGLATMGSWERLGNYVVLNCGERG